MRLLIGTDVLAEGLNLQDARVVISYDLPWNPVRLAQRIGRIDRLGSPHAWIRALAFAPDRGVDELLGLMKRIRRKLRQIRIVGGDAPWSLANATTKTRVIDEIDAAGDARERARAIWHAAATPDCEAGLHVDSAGPCVGAASWSDDHHAALCCFSIGCETLLVLAHDARPAEVGTAACWFALADVLEGENAASPERSAYSEAGALQAAALAAEQRARKALRRRSAAGASTRPERSTALAGAAVLRWLAERPGSPSCEEAEWADSVLRRLSVGRRAGADIRLQHSLRGSASEAAASLDDVVRSLLATPGEAREETRRKPLS
ncbi:MAG: helicase-related protein, partial [Longimicrobiales bacterium]